ncbi:MucB/RseB C-terminal domain-containing protein [Dokdonella sp.]|uniref:MucB/RseB C-terminal domain-containing protein n=1 Tax=Dokdonella sp. TaxID=2291710 RepID=UPI0031C4CFE3|nr:MucB/RseB C-terminal domain-containing protein [Dokdonella sp.]
MAEPAFPSRRGGAAGWVSGVARVMFALAVLGAGGALQAAEATTPEGLLMQMNRALASLDYQGSFVYEHDGRLDALRIFHAGAGRGRARLVSLSGPRSEVVRIGNSVTCLHGSAPSMLFRDEHDARLLPLLPNLSARAAQHYTVRAGGSDRVAGYHARIVEVVPRDEFLYGYRVWIEEGAHLPLRAAIIDARQRALEQFMFVSLEIGAVPKEGDLAAGAEVGLLAAATEAPLRTTHWQVADLPPGFVLVRTQQPVAGPQGAEHQIYTDGLANVSVYVEPVTADRTAPERVATRGVINAWTHARDGWQVTALGDVPAATVERMARSARLLEPSR